MKKISEEFIFTMVVIAIIIVIAVGSTAFFSYFEMKSFNRCTGSNATLGVAMTTNLRIEKCELIDPK